MKNFIHILVIILISGFSLFAQIDESYPVDKEKQEIKELSFIGYYLMRMEQSNVAATNEFLKGQTVGRLFGGNTTQTSDQRSSYIEQRFIPMFTYSPRLFDGWAKMRMSFELDWTWGDANYGAGGNFGGGFAGDFVNLQTQNLFIEFRPQNNLIINAGLTRIFDNVNVPWYTFTSTLLNTGYRLAFWGSDATGLVAHYALPGWKFKAGAYQLYENRVEKDDDVNMFEAHTQYDLDIVNSVGFSLWYVRDHGNGQGGVSILGQGLNSGLTAYNGVFNFNFGDESYKADIFWLGTHFHGNPLLSQGRFGYNGFAVMNFGKAYTNTRNIDIMGFAGNLRGIYQYGKNANDYISIDGIFTTGDEKNIDDGKYTGVLTGNNWSSPGAVYFTSGLYLLMPHGYVVNRFYAAVLDIQNIGYGLGLVNMNASYDIIPNKVKAKIGAGAGISPVAPFGGGNSIGTEINFNLLYRPKVFMELELHAAYLFLGDFYDSSVVNGGLAKRPQDPWTVFATLKWIMF